MTSRVRPARPISPIAAAVLILGIWWLVAHNSGDGWVQALGDLVFGTLLVGIIGPAVFLRRARLEVINLPLDCVAGRVVDMQLRASTRVRVRPVAPAGAEGYIGPGRAGAPTGSLSLCPEYRGVYTHLVLDVATAAPFALQWWSRRVRVALPIALYVRPRTGAPDVTALAPREGAGDGADRPELNAGYPRGARPYRPGDTQRQVHWRATAHANELMVRESELPAAEPYVIALRLPADPDGAERMAERAQGTIALLLDRGDAVVLETDEEHGRVIAAVESARVAGRRLARAVAPGGVPAGASGPGVAP